jgi:hypothetical protein
LKLFFSYFLIVFHKRCNYFLIDFVPFCPMAAKKKSKKNWDFLIVYYYKNKLPHVVGCAI